MSATSLMLTRTTLPAFISANLDLSISTLFLSAAAQEICSEPSHIVLTAFDGSFSTVEISAVPVISTEARVNAHPLILQPDVCNSLALSASISNATLYGASNVFPES